MTILFPTLLKTFHFLFTNFGSFASFNECNIFCCSNIYLIILQLMNLKKVSNSFWQPFSCENIVAPSSSSTFPVKWTCWGIPAFICLDKSVSLWSFNYANNLINFLLNNRYLFTFRKVFHTPLVFPLADEKLFYCQLMH